MFIAESKINWYIFSKLNFILIAKHAPTSTMSLRTRMSVSQEPPRINHMKQALNVRGTNV